MVSGHQRRGSGRVETSLYSTHEQPYLLSKEESRAESTLLLHLKVERAQQSWQRISEAFSCILRFNLVNKGIFWMCISFQEENSITNHSPIQI